MGFQFLGSGKILGLPTQIWIAVLFSLIAIYILEADASRSSYLQCWRKHEGSTAVRRERKKDSAVCVCLLNVCAAYGRADHHITARVAAIRLPGEMWETKMQLRQRLREERPYQAASEPLAVRSLVLLRSVFPDRWDGHGGGA